MTWYDVIKLNYDWGMYTKEQVYEFVRLNKITEEEANRITGNTPPR